MLMRDHAAGVTGRRDLGCAFIQNDCSLPHPGFWPITVHTYIHTETYTDGLI